MASPEHLQLAEQIYLSEVDYREVRRLAANIVDLAVQTDADLAQLETYQQQLLRDEEILESWLTMLRDGGMTASEFQESIGRAHTYKYNQYAAQYDAAQAAIEQLQPKIDNDTPDPEELTPYETLSDGTIRWADIEARIVARDRRRLRNQQELQTALQLQENSSVMRDHCAQTEGSPIWQL